MEERVCSNCGKDRTKEGHDGCLGELIGITNACCGHGKKNEAYIQFLDGTGIYGEDAILLQEILKRNSVNYNKINSTKQERLKFLKSSIPFYEEEWGLRA